jgi:hypothetical protein
MNIEKVRELLAEWRGSHVCVSEYTTSHSVLIIRLSKRHIKQNVHMGCSGVSRMILPKMRWRDAEFRIEKFIYEPDPKAQLQMYRLIDEKAGLVVECQCFGFRFNVEPIWGMPNGGRPDLPPPPVCEPLQ